MSVVGRRRVLASVGSSSSVLLPLMRWPDVLGSIV